MLENQEMQEDELALTAENPPRSITAAAKATGRFAVHARYWVNGLHNLEGLELAEEINKQVQASKLNEKEDAIKQLLLAYPTAMQLGLSVVDEQIYLEDAWRKRNLAQPKDLMGGTFVRDKNGAYRPAGGGRAVLIDQGDTLKLKAGEKSLDAAVELAKAKGWTAMSLTGKPKVVEAAWIAAQLAGIEVTNYTPTKEAQAKLAERLAQQPVTQGNYEGKILDVQGNQVIQKTGRDPDVFVRHDIANLSRIPARDEVVGILYKDGKGLVSGKELGKSGPAR